MAVVVPLVSIPVHAVGCCTPCRTGFEAFKYKYSRTMQQSNVEHPETCIVHTMAKYKVEEGAITLRDIL